MTQVSPPPKVFHFSWSNYMPNTLPKKPHIFYHRKVPFRNFSPETCSLYLVSNTSHIQLNKPEYYKKAEKGH